MVLYMAVVIFIGVYYAKRANKHSDNYFLGGRSLGPWVTAMSAEASDMSGWLLMGLPGLAYFVGVAEATWTAIGLAVCTYINWLVVSKRLRRYSERANNSITLPDFFSNRFREKKKVIMTIAAVFILVFFAVYAASCFVTCGKLFSNLFFGGKHYVGMMILGAVFVLAYTFLGGFLAESASDFMQGIVMIVSLVVIVTIGVFSAGGVGAIIDNVKEFPGFLDFFGVSDPVNQFGQSFSYLDKLKEPELEALAESLSTTVDGLYVQGVNNALPIFSSTPGTYSILSICSCMAWGLGYFGMPQVLLRFMAIRDEKELKPSRRIAMIWVVVSLAVAVFIGIMGRHLFPTVHLTGAAAENIFITLATNALPAILAGFVMAGILAATISSSDSYLLIAASAVSKNIFKGVIHKKATDKQVMWVTRITLLVIAIVAIVIALDENSIIFKIVSFAWAGFGATFGPLMLFSLFWKRTTAAGAVAGMVGGAGMVFLWKLVISGFGSVFAIYELLPAFIFSSICIVVVSLLTKKPSEEIEADFEAVKSGNL